MLQESPLLDRRFDLLLDAETYKKMEREKLLFLESRVGVNRDAVSFQVIYDCYYAALLRILYNFWSIFNEATESTGRKKLLDYV